MQKVFEKIIERLEEYPTYSFGVSLLNTEEYIKVSDLVEIVNQVASEHGGGWIPCSERLPNGSELWLGHDITDAEPREFIVMVKGAYEPTTGYYTDDGWVRDIYNKENGIGYANEIVAWRFFPETYKAECEE